MTRLAVLADIHGNLPALEAVQRDVGRNRVDRVIVAGDAIHWGPSSAAVIDIIQREDWAVIRGNNEFYLLDYGTPRAPISWSSPDFQSLTWLLATVDDEHRAIIATWPDTLSLRYADAPAIRVVHGSPRSNGEAMFAAAPDDALATMLAGIDEPFVIAGHTHLPMDRTVAGWRIFNPGSVGLPLDGISAGQYLLLEGDTSSWEPTWRRVAYDRRPLFEALDNEHLVERCGPVGELIIEEFRTNRMWVNAFVNWRNRHYPGRPFDAELLREFRRADRWQYTEQEYHVNRDGH